MLVRLSKLYPRFGLGEEARLDASLGQNVLDGGPGDDTAYNGGLDVLISVERVFCVGGKPQPRPRPWVAPVVVIARSGERVAVAHNRVTIVMLEYPAAPEAIGTGTRDAYPQGGEAVILPTGADAWATLVAISRLGEAVVAEPRPAHLAEGAGVAPMACGWQRCMERSPRDGVG